MGKSSLPPVRGRHQRGNGWRYAVPVLGYSVAAALAVVAGTSAHFGQLRSEEAANSNFSNSARVHATPNKQGYLPGVIAPATTPPPVPPAPTEAQAAPEPTSEPTATKEPTAAKSTSTRSTPPKRATTQTTSKSAPTTATPTRQPTTSAPSTSEPTTSQPTTSEPAPGEQPQQPNKGVDGIVHGLTDPVLGLLG